MRELMRLQLAKQYRAGFLQQLRCGRVERWDVIHADFRAAGREQAFGVVDIFERKGDAVQRAAITSGRNLRFSITCLFASLVRGQCDERVQLRLECLNAFEQCIG